MNELGAENGSIKQKGVFVSLFLSYFIFLLFLRYLFVFYWETERMWIQIEGELEKNWEDGEEETKSEYIV